MYIYRKYVDKIDIHSLTYDASSPFSYVRSSKMRMRRDRKAKKAKKGERGAREEKGGR